jgi:membrane fusion protein
VSDELFRKEVFAHRQDHWLGPIRLQPPRLGWVFLGMGTIAVLSIAALLILDRYAPSAWTHGAFAPNESQLLSPAAGVVTRVAVREGDKVRAGQPLVEISPVKAGPPRGGDSPANAATKNDRSL